MEDNKELTVSEASVNDSKKTRQSLASSVYDWIEIIIISVATVFILFSFVARIAVVDGSSMLPTLSDGDKLIVRHLFYTPKQGDIIVCQSQTYGLEKPLVKRIIATEGQTVSIDRLTWTVYVDGVALKEDYIYREGGYMVGWEYDTDTITVKEGHVFVMGDHRNDSLDSRTYRVGQIDERYIIGKVVFRFMPFKSFGPVK